LPSSPSYLSALPTIPPAPFLLLSLPPSGTGWLRRTSMANGQMLPVPCQTRPRN
jgi:hypothetical protein